jgi:hypothetical protein
MTYVAAQDHVAAHEVARDAAGIGGVGAQPLHELDLAPAGRFVVICPHDKQ